METIRIRHAALFKSRGDAGPQEARARGAELRATMTKRDDSDG